MSGSRPVYRREPRSHAYGCPCDRCVQVRRDRAKSGGGLIAFDMGCLAVISAAAVISAVCGWAAKNSHAILYAIRHAFTLPASIPAAAVAVLAAVIVAVAVLNKREKRRPPKGPLNVEATPWPAVSLTPSAAPPPPEPACYHVNAVPVDLRTKERVGWLCPDCQEGLPPEHARVRRVCCSTYPGTEHWWNCVHAPEGAA